ncbi:MAG: hypothetical protein ACRDTC_19510, partial [Pseudonocardiaceae bacterium]
RDPPQAPQDHPRALLLSALPGKNLRVARTWAGKWPRVRVRPAGPTCPKPDPPEGAWAWPVFVRRD